MVRNTTITWGWPAKLLHWISALAIVVLFAHGWWMTHVVARPDRIVNYNWHAALGYDVLVLLVLRLLWRWANPVPAQPSDSQRWERIAAQVGHVGLYVLLFGASLTGWTVATTFRTPITRDLLGLSFPAIVTDRAFRNLYEESHVILSYLLAALIVVHIAGALRHHFIKHNDVLRRMWFAVKGA